ncbi:MAG: M14 family metallopeptidase [Actinomycetota bacterium]
MRKLMVIALVSLLLLAVAPTGRTDTAAPAVVRVHATSDAEAAYLMSAFDETHNHSAGEIELLLWPGDRAELDALGLDYEVVTENLFADDLAAHSGPKPLVELPGPDRTDYRRLPDYNAELQKLAKKNKGLVKLFEMPNPSLEGRTIYGVEIAANVDEQDGRPIFYLDGVHHAREWPASEFTLLYAYHLVENYGKDRAITKLLKKTRVIVVPIVNVDGFDYSRESLAQNSLLGAGNGFEGYWRKNRRSFTGVTAPGIQKNPDAYGVDPNRNYAYLWGDQNGGSSNFFFDQTYRGAAPWSEPEVVNVRDIILDRPVTAVLTNHTYQATVLRAGGGKAPDDRVLEAVGARMAQALDFRNVPTVGYPTTGTTDDWSYAATGSLGFTIEHGSQGFHPPYATGVGDPTDKTMEAFQILHAAAADPRYHAIIKGHVPGDATLTLKKTFKTPLSEGNPIGEEFVTEKLSYELAVNGKFTWHVPSSNRPYEKKAESYTLVISSGGKTKTLEVNVDWGDVHNLGHVKF